MTANFNGLKSYYAQITNFLNVNPKFTPAQVTETINLYTIRINEIIEDRNTNRINQMKNELQTELNQVKPNIKGIQNKLTALDKINLERRVDAQVNKERKQYMTILNRRKEELEQELNQINKIVTVTKQQHENEMVDLSGCMMINSPHDTKLFENKLKQAHSQFQEDNRTWEQFIKDNEPVQGYYLNRLSNIDDIKNHFKMVNEVEEKPFKMSTSVGVIVEHINNSGENYTYHIFNPNLYTLQEDPIVIKNEEDKNEFLEHIFELVDVENVNKLKTDDNDDEEGDAESSASRIIAIIRVGFFVYRLHPSGARLPLLDKFIDNK